ncbi:SH3 domain binding glutamate rich protein Sh3beta [Brevipalpus obovatus]|uniref:SH3 domain binding glutamate rich protein Sh3beta n=1 Tax=Brevipalpus obovatus TaxID=246614 RepID=UPI003D9EB600
MVVKIYLSSISASKEVKKRQQRAQFIMDSLRIDYEKIDITEPDFEEEKQRMKICKSRNDQPALPPQFFNDEKYCGDWLDFEAASEEDIVHEFLKLTPPAPDQRLNRVDSMTERQASVTSNEPPQPVADNDPKPETATENNHEENNDPASEPQSDRKSSIAQENSNASSKKSSRAPSEEKANSSSKKSSRAPSEEKANSSKKSSRAASEEKEKSKSPSKKSSRAASEEKSKSNQSSRKSSRAASETKEKENDEPSKQRETTPSGDEPLTSNETDE